MIKVKRNNRLKMGMEARVRHVKLLKLKKRYQYMTGGSRSRFLIGFALSQLKSNRKKGFHSKLPTKSGRRWTITFLGQKTDSPPEDYVKDESSVSEESESEGKVEEGEDHLDGYESSLSDDKEDYPQGPPLEPTFSFELRSQLVDDRNNGLAAKPSVECPLMTQTFTIRSLRILGLGPILERIKEHISTSHCHHAPLKDIVFRGSLDGCSPLLLACHDGDLKTVKYLVENWGVGVNETAVYYKFLDAKPEIEKASPVFVASYNRHFTIVEYLIGKGVDISLKTTSAIEYYHNLTPLLGAIRTHLSGAFWYDTCGEAEPLNAEIIVIPLVRLLLENGASPSTHHGHSICSGLAAHSVNLTTLLVHHGMALDEQDCSGETVIHHWANLENTNTEDSLTVVKLLVDKGANLMIRDKNGNTPILTAVESLNWTVVDFLVENDGLDRTEKIDALELAAATIISESGKYDSHVELAHEYLRRALTLREEKPNPILKTPLTLESGRTIEWTTRREVEAGIKKPTEYKIQSYLTFTRIFLGKSLISGRLMLGSLSVCFSDLLKQRRFDDIRDVLWITLDASRRNVLLSNSERLEVIIDVVKHVLSMMSQLENNHPLFIADTFKKPLEFILETELPFHRRHREDILLQFVAFLARNAKILIDEEVKESLCKLLAQECKESRVKITFKTLLDMACSNPEDLSTIRLLLLSGANPNESDYFYGNCPLHILAIKDRVRRLSGIDDDVIGCAARLLLKYGAHLCKVNQNRETAAQVWKRENGNQNDLLPDWLREEKVAKLSCQSARVITSLNIPYEELELPATLYSFIEAHRYKSVF